VKKEEEKWKSQTMRGI